MKVIRGGIYLADLGSGVESEMQGIRPVIVVQNQTGNRYSPGTITIPLSTSSRKDLPMHIQITPADLEYGFIRDSIALCEQIRAIGKTRLIEPIGKVNEITMKNIENAMLFSLGVKIHTQRAGVLV